MCGVRRGDNSAIMEGDGEVVDPNTGIPLSEMTAKATEAGTEKASVKRRRGKKAKKRTKVLGDQQVCAMLSTLVV